LFFLATVFCNSAQAKTTLPLPRFVSLKSQEANVRAGPGLRYQIKWVVVRKNIPVEVIAEFEQWRKVKDMQGDEGWIHRSQLTNKRNVVITGEVTQVIHKYSSPDSLPVARAEPGVVAELLSCNQGACRVRAEGYRGWVRRENLWGIYPEEIVD